MQVGQERRHLLIRKSAGERWHHPLSVKDYPLHFLVRGGSAAGKLVVVKDRMKIGRHLLEAQVVILVAVRATPLVEMLPLGLLLGEAGAMAAADPDGQRE